MKKLLLKHPYWTALIVYLVCAWFSTGQSAPDEYSQILEFAIYKYGYTLNDIHFVLPWEFYHQIRGTLQPTIVFMLLKASDFIFGGFDPFIIVFTLRVLSAIVSLIGIRLLIKALSPEIKNSKYLTWFILLSLFTWVNVLCYSHFNSEGCGGKIMVLSIALIILNRQHSYSRYAMVGILFGFAFLCRFQCGFMIAGIYIWQIFIARIKFSKLSVQTISLLLIIALGVLIDWWFYGNLVFTPWNYFRDNILLGVAESFGKNAWYYYPLFSFAFVPYGLLFPFAVIIFIWTKPRHILTYAVGIFILAHLFVGHKEIRFLVPVLPYLPFMIIISCIKLKEYPWFQKINISKLNKIAWKINLFFLCIVCLTPTSTDIILQKYFYYNYTKPYDFYTVKRTGNLVDFYRRENVNIVRIESYNTIDCATGKTCFVGYTCGQYQELESTIHGKLSYDGCYPWLYKINIGNWMERTSLYKVYDISTANTLK